MVTVSQYFEERALEDPSYNACMLNGKLRYPFLPTINVGTNKKGIFVPIELLTVPSGQARHKVNSEIVSQIIKQAAVRPQARLEFLTQASNNGVISRIRNDDDAKAFGVSSLGTEFMPVAARLLPPAKIQYGGNRTVDPKFDGKWNAPNGAQVAHLPKKLSEGLRVSCVYVFKGREPSNQNLDQCAGFMASLIKEASAMGVKLVNDQRVEPWTHNLRDDDQARLSFSQVLMKVEARLVIVLLEADCYDIVKVAGDNLAQVTQCIKWKNVERPPRGYARNVMIKVTTKLGGTNHTLASRGGGQQTFQQPPKSISWVFDEPCMLVGVDVSHPEPGQDKVSVAAIVGSMDGYAGQYVAVLSASKSKSDVISNLQDGMVKLLETFKARNGSFPKRVGKYSGSFLMVLATFPFPRWA